MIVLHRYVQTDNATRVSSMQKWIEAVWTQVPCGWACNTDFQNNVQRLEDANDARLIFFGIVGMNNYRCEAQKNARKVGCN